MPPKTTVNFAAFYHPAPFSWSLSRHQTLERCPLSYCWNYYASSGGWKNVAPPEVQEAYRLKQMTSAPQQIGTMVHQFAAYLVSQVAEGNNPGILQQNPQSWANLLRSRLSQKWQGAHTALANGTWHADPKSVEMFVELYNGIAASPLTANRSAKIDAIAANLFASKTLAELAGYAGHPGLKIVERDAYRGQAPRPIPNQPLTVQVAPQQSYTVTVYVKPDLVYETPAGDLVIVDWKTGQPSPSDAVQLELYAWYAQQAYASPKGSIILRNEYLENGTVQETACSPASASAAPSFIESSVQNMAGYVAHGDLAQNQPVAFAAFPQMPGASATSQVCRWCQYRTLCF